MAGGTTLKLGYSDPLTDSFGAHPLLGAVLDLNDGATFTLVSPDGLELPAPPRTLVLGGNIRTQGERATRAITRHNRTVTARLIVGPSSSSAALLASLRTLLTWLAAPPAIPITLQYQPFNASTPLYLDVVGAAHHLPSDEGQWLRGQFEPLTLTFLCRPGLRGARLTLQNLLPNAGFEQPSTAPVPAFSDDFSSANAYALQAGGSPTLSNQVLTLPAGTRVAFGSPAWGALSQWQIRWQYVSGLAAKFHLHYSDGSNQLWVQYIGSTGEFSIVQRIAGVATPFVLTTQTLTSGAWYWLQVTQYPTPPGEIALVQATLLADSAGAPGALIKTIGPAPTLDGVTALSGRPQLEAVTGTAALALGGAFANVHTISLFGPGGWQFSSFGGSAPASGAWEGQGVTPPRATNTYPDGPVASLGAARLDAPPAGTWDANWIHYGGGAPNWGTPGTWALAVGAAQTLNISGWARSVGLGANAGLHLIVREYDASGALLRLGQAGPTLIGNQAAWVQLGGSYTTGANCAYVGVGCRAFDTSAAGASANATVWFDNLLCWNMTQLAAQNPSQSSMPWCDLRAVVSPATLVVSGVQGDLPAPAHLAVGAYLAASPGLPAGGKLALYLGRKGQTSPSAQLVNGSHGAYDPAFTPQSSAGLDATAYGGYVPTATFGNGGGWNPRTLSPTAADAAGSYHLLARVKSAQSSGNLPNLSLRVALAQQTDAWINQPDGSDIVGEWEGPYVSPLVAANTWTIADVGQCILPPFPQGALADPTMLYLTPRAQWQDTSASSAAAYTNWQALLPVDGSLLVATVNNPANSAGAVAGAWLWVYSDGLLVNRAGAADGPAWLYGRAATPTPTPAQGAGGAGTQGSGAINVNSGADPYLLLDPTLAGNSTAMGVNQGVNQVVAIVSDQVGTVLPCYTEISYAPLYLEPR